MVKVTKPSTMEEISHAISVYQRFDHFTKLSYSRRTKRGRMMDFWTFPPSSLSDLPDLLRTNHQNVIETKTMDSWLYQYGRFILDWTSHRKTALPSLFSDVHRFWSGTSVSQYRDGIVSTMGRPVMHRKNDSRSRSLVTTRLHDRRTLVLSIAPALLPTSNPTVVCVDEFAFRKGHDDGVAVMDTQTRNVLSIASGKNKEAIVEALQPVASKVKYVVSDLAPAMRKAMEKVCPKAIHVLDHFHVIQLFTDALERCRKYLAKGGTKHGSVRRVCRLLSQRPEKWTEEERQEVRQWCQESAYLRDVYQALQHFRYVSKSQTRKQAETRLTQWFDRYLFSDCAAVRRIAKALITRRDAVLSCIVFSYSNGPMEGINNKIKWIKRRGYGYRNIQRFTLRVCLETSITF